MATMRDIRRRIASIRNIRQITKAMNMIASAKFAKAQVRLLAFTPYAKAVDEMARNIAIRTSPDSNPLLGKREPRRGIIVLITSDRGLCGAFNANVIDHGTKLLREGYSLFLIGRKGAISLSGSPYEIIEEIRMPEVPTLSFSQGIGERIAKGYALGETDEVFIVYNEFVTIPKQRVRVMRLLPIEAKRPPGFITEHLYEPDRGVLDEVLFHYITTQILYALLHSSSSEHAARMLAMDNATKNASQMIDELTLSFNKARQASITKEMIELTTSLEAISG